jgi:hypothetical protein
MRPGLIKPGNALHLRCERQEDWNNLFRGLLHDERQRFQPDKAEQLPNDGYHPPMVLNVYGQTVYVYPPLSTTPTSGSVTVGPFTGRCI